MPINPATRPRLETGQFVPVHGQRFTRLYRIWTGMRSRCTNPKEEKWPIYGARGIRVDPTWEDFTVFAAWAAVNGYADDLQIDRKDTDKDYAPDNCRFVTCLVNNNNRRNNRRVEAFGEVKTVADWSRDPRCRVPQTTLYRRLRLMPEAAIEDMLTLPVRAGSSLRKRGGRAD